MYVHDKGRTMKRCSLIGRSFEVRWDPISAMGELNMEVYPFTEDLAAVLSDRVKLMSTVIFPASNKNRSKTLNVDGVRTAVKTSRGRGKKVLTTADGQRAAIAKTEPVLHGLRHSGIRDLLQHATSPEMAKMLLDHIDGR